MVNPYERYVLPRLIDIAMRSPVVAEERRRRVPCAAGIVLEVGIGSGLNLPFYGRGVERLYGVDPRRELWALARARLARVSFPVEFIEASAERVPLGDDSIDTVVTTWTLCSIPRAPLALLEMKRLLRPDGQLLFIEHGLAPDPRVARWQRRLDPVWRRIAGGCHLDRDIDGLIRDAGFEVTESERGYGVGPRPMAYLYRGLARPPRGRAVTPLTAAARRGGPAAPAAPPLDDAAAGGEDTAR
jgi:SAM-dependent methyltransferase